MSEGWKDGVWERFKGAVCWHPHYVPVRVRKPSGHWYRTEFYQCARCSVMFRDPVKFSGMMFENPATKEMRPGGALKD